MSTERDAGLQALQQGNPAEAAPLLETACQQNPTDFDALLFLGAAYGQIGRQMDAINTITRAVQVQPANAQARYNLAVAMEQGGYRDQAITALGQALTLQPDYPKAQEALRRLQGGGASAGTGGGSMGSGSMDSGAAPGYGQGAPASGQAQPGYGQSAEPSGAPQPGFGRVVENQPPAYAPPAGGYGQPAGSQGLNQNQAPAPGYGQQPQPQYGAPAPNAYTPQQGAPNPYAPQQPPANTYAQPGTPNPYAPPGGGTYGAPAAAPYGVPPAVGPYGQAAQYQQKPHRESYPDSFDLAQAARDWLAVLTKPAQFFRDDRIVGSTGMLAPLALALLYFVPIIVAAILGNSHSTAAFSKLPGLGPAFAAGGFVLGMMILVPIVIVGLFVTAWVLHLVGLLFGNRSAYSASFRALVFAYAPAPLIMLLRSLVTMGGENAVGGILSLVTLIWFATLLVMAISSEQEIEIGPAVGVVIISLIASVIAAIGFGIALGIILAIVFAAAAAGSRGMIPLQ